MDALIVVNPKFMKSQDGFPKNLNVKVNTKQNIKCIASQDASHKRLNLYTVVLATTLWEDIEVISLILHPEVSWVHHLISGSV